MKICYFGIYDTNFSRNKIYMRGLRSLGVEVIECQSNAKGWIKYWRLWRMHSHTKKDYDALIVGYPGHVVVPLAKIISRKLVIADTLGSLYDAERYSHGKGYLSLLKSRLIDWLAVIFADRVLLESEAQKKYFERRFGRREKYAVVYTGVDESLFKPAHSNGEKPVDFSEKFIVVFRGKLTPECGIEYILKAAEMLRDNDSISFKIIGRGYLLERTIKTIREVDLKNVELISEYLSDDDFYRAVSSASVYLGQFGNNPRLKRTIPHKAFEALVMGIPYVTADEPAIRELVRDGETVFLIQPADASALASRIEFLSRNPELLRKVSENSHALFKNKLTSDKLAQKIISLIHPSS